MIVVFGTEPRRPVIATGSSDDPVRATPSAAAPMLVVDDDPDIVDMIREALESDGHAVVTASDGQEGLDRVRSVRPAAVFLDMRMPVMNGWEFARAARAGGMTAPIVVITAASDARVWASEISAEAYLAKPFTIDQLLALADRFRAGRSS